MVVSQDLSIVDASEEFCVTNQTVKALRLMIVVVVEVFFWNKRKGLLDKLETLSLRIGKF